MNENNGQNETMQSSEEIIESLTKQVSDAKESRRAALVAMEHALSIVNPKGGQYLRGLYNGLLTGIGVISGVDQGKRMVADDSEAIVIAQEIPQKGITQ